MKKGFTKPFIHVIFLLASVVWLFSQENTIRIGDRIIELDDDILFENFDLRIPRNTQRQNQPPQQPQQPVQQPPQQPVQQPPQQPVQQPPQTDQSAQQVGQNAPLTNEEGIISNYILTNIYNSYVTNTVTVTNFVNERVSSNFTVVTNIYNYSNDYNFYYNEFLTNIVSNILDKNAFSNYFSETISNLYHVTNEYITFFNEMLKTFDEKQVTYNTNNYNYQFSEIVSNIYFRTNDYNYYYSDFYSTYITNIFNRTNEYNYFYTEINSNISFDSNTYNFSNFQSNFITNTYNYSNDYGFYYSEFYTNIVTNTYNFSNTQVNITNLENTFNNSNYYNFFYNQYYTNNYSNIVTNTYNVSNYYGVVVGEGIDAESLSNAEIGPDGKLSIPNKNGKRGSIGSGNIDVPLMLLQTRDLARKKRYREALALLGVIERNEPNNTRMLNMKGSVFYKLQFYEYALDAWGKSLSINSDQPVVQYYYNRAAVRLRTIR